MIRKTFPGPLIDEVRLAEQALPLAQSYGGKIPDAQELQRLTVTLGIDLATMIYYQCLLHSTEQSEFIRRVSEAPVSARQATLGKKLLIVPSWLYREHPEWNADGAIASQVATQCGLSPFIIPCVSRGSLLENVRIILETLSAQSDEKVWILAYSKGVLELRYAFQHFPDHPGLRKIEKWIAFSGNANGSPLVDLLLGERLRRAGIQCLARVNGISFEGFLEMGARHPYWKKPFRTPDGMEAINVQGIPLIGHLQKISLRGYRRLSALGPNDGSVLLGQSTLLPGKIYPVWGVDHFFRTPQLASIFYRLFNYLLEKESTYAAERREVALNPRYPASSPANNAPNPTT